MPDAANDWAHFALFLGGGGGSGPSAGPADDRWCTASRTQRRLTAPLTHCREGTGDSEGGCPGNILSEPCGARIEGCPVSGSGSAPEDHIHDFPCSSATLRSPEFRFRKAPKSWLRHQMVRVCMPLYQRQCRWAVTVGPLFHAVLCFAFCDRALPSEDDMRRLHKGLTPAELC